MFLRPASCLSAACIAIALILIADVSAARSHFPDELRSALNRISGYIYDDKFELARRSIDSLEREFPSDPVVPLFRAILFQSEMMSEESDRLEPDFYDLLVRVKSGADSILARGGDSALAWYLKGQADALRSLRLGRSGHTWGAIKAGMAAGKEYSKGYEADSQFYDIGLGLGSYKYWKSVKGKVLTWAFLLKNEKDDGIALLRQAMDSSEISSDAAATSLIWIYLNEERYPEAIRLTDRMGQKYPNGLTFDWAMAEIYFEMDDWRTAAAYYTNLLDRLMLTPGNGYNIIEASYYLIKCYKNLDERDSSWGLKINDIKSGLDTLKIPESTQKRQQKKLDAIRKIKADISD